MKPGGVNPPALARHQPLEIDLGQERRARIRSRERFARYECWHSLVLHGVAFRHGVRGSAHNGYRSVGEDKARVAALKWRPERDILHKIEHNTVHSLKFGMLKLLIIDPQNDFCDSPGAALPVAGANEDLRRLSRFISTVQPDEITVTLDSHPSVAVERTTFWRQADGAAVAPFTFVTLAEVQAGVYVPRNRSLLPAVTTMLQKLALAGRDGLVVWPVHCVTGTWGHNIQSDLMQALTEWEFVQQKAVQKVLKGEYYLTEHFGAFEADAPNEAVASTQFNVPLAESLLANTSTLIFAGQASSHCVAASFEQLARYIRQHGKPSPRLIVLKDCMSPVPGFEALADAFFARAAAFGAQILSAEEAVERAHCG